MLYINNQALTSPIFLQFFIIIIIKIMLLFLKLYNKLFV